MPKSGSAQMPCTSHHGGSRDGPLSQAGELGPFVLGESRREPLSESVLKERHSRLNGLCSSSDISRSQFQVRDFRSREWLRLFKKTNDILPEVRHGCMSMVSGDVVVKLLPEAFDWIVLGRVGR